MTLRDRWKTCQTCGLSAVRNRDEWLVLCCSSAGLVAQMRTNGNQWVHKDVKVTLAQAYGYCWGVERAVQMAYEARKQFPERRMHITNEIIHNPAVNQASVYASCQ